MLTLAVNPYLTGLLVALFVLISVTLMLIVLIQRPQGGGLSEAFGSGAGSGHTAFGAKTGDALTTATIIVFVLFLGTGIGLNYIVGPDVAADPQPQLVDPDTTDETAGNTATEEAAPGTGAPNAFPIQIPATAEPEDTAADGEAADTSTGSEDAAGEGESPADDAAGSDETEPSDG